MEQKQYTLLLTEIECLHSSAEDSRDDVFLDIYVDGYHDNYYYKSNPLKMNEYDHDDVKRHLDIEVKVTVNSSVKIYLWDKDNNPDDLLGEFTITRDDPIEGSRIVKQITNKQKAQYKVSWRVLTKPIPTVRVHGIMCQKSSANCNADLIGQIATVTAHASEMAGYALAKVKTPKAQAISKGFKAAADVIEDVAAFVTWLANFTEGDDDIYLQHVDPPSGDADGGAFCPPDGIKSIKMDDGDEVYFFETYGKYFRLPLDKGDVTIQIKDRDRSSDDDSLGSLTIGESEFNQLLEKGAQVLAASEYLHGSGQGAVYHLCYSVAYEDWVLPPTQVDEDVIPPDPDPDPTPLTPISIGQTLSGTWDAGTLSTHRPGFYAQDFVFSVPATTTVRISLTRGTSYLNNLISVLKGSGPDGDLVRSANKQLVCTLEMGTYMIEPTSQATGSFELSLLEREVVVPTPISIGQTLSGTWDSATPSTHSPGYYSKYFVFSVPASTTTRITVDASLTRETSDINTLMFLLKGSGPDGDYLTNKYGVLGAVLGAGTYTIEATTREAGEGQATGSFEISLSQRSD